ncbi:MAG TPA: hypothetical protein VKG26_11320, partial [Bacteroidia bacterium]|nr:hypothetical protein [Bacteroidia bacterium]
VIIISSLAILFGTELIFSYENLKSKFDNFSLGLKSTCYLFLIMFVLFTGLFHSNQEFIYFQF